MEPVSTAIVAEGGGQRGIYTAGVLDAFLQKSFNPFDTAYGVSAGAQNLLAYFLEQKGYAKRAIEELTAHPDFFVPYRWLGTRGIIDLDGYFDRTLSDPDYQLPYQRISSVQQQRRLLFVATDRETLEPVYLEPDQSTVVDYLKASSAIPFLYKSGVQVDGRVLVDGGVADPIPARRAYLQGARRLIVIRTSPSSDPDTSWRNRLEQMRRLKALPALVLDMLVRHESAMSDAFEFLSDPPADLQLIQVAPESALDSQVFGSRSEALLNDYVNGQIDGHRAALALVSWTKPDA
jgi:predicted patatin/cPLA2 family phospholipase